MEVVTLVVVGGVGFALGMYASSQLEGWLNGGIGQNEKLLKQMEEMDHQEQENAIFDEFPEYQRMRLGDFDAWYSNMPPVARARFKELQEMVQDNKRR